MHLTLDVANELYPLRADETVSLAVARSLVPEELADEEPADEDGEGVKRIKRELWRSGDQGLAADYEYVMYGKVGAGCCSGQGGAERRRYTSTTTRYQGRT